MKKIRVIIVLLAIVAVAGAGFWAWDFSHSLAGATDGSVDSQAAPTGAEENAKAEPARPRPITVRAVEMVDTEQNRSYPGTTQSSAQAKLAFRVGGPLVEVNVAPGTQVKKGDVMMRIDPRDFKDSITILEAQLQGAKSSRENQELEYKRIMPLWKKQVVSKSDYDTARTALASSDAEVKRLEAQLQVARHQLADTELIAPFDGIVTSQEVENHEQVQAGQVVLEMHNISDIEINVNVPETEMPYFNMSDDTVVDVTFSPLPGRVFKAHMKEWSATADPVTRTYLLTFTMPTPEGVKILPGMTAEVKWSPRSGSNAMLVIPATAVIAGKGEGSSVWVFDPKTSTASPRSITLASPDGPSLSDMVQVLAGLDEGELVVTGGMDFITKGMLLRPLVKSSN